MNTRIIHHDAVYYAADLAKLFGFTASTIRTARRKTGLRTGKRMGRSYVLGAWLLEWFAAGELPVSPESSSRRPPERLSSAGRQNHGG